ncbi:MAG: hypothetical protein F7C34_02515 [Desulfurococcales archaeon]|nr:hypothetical protein [Desulfurococcales archaeon]
MAVELKRGIYAVVGLIGYILSPASWWNDAVVNIPIALAIAEILERVSGLPREAGFAAAYWATNLAGIVLMLVGMEGAGRSRVTLRSLLAGLALGSLYTVLVIAGLRLLG